MIKYFNVFLEFNKNVVVDAIKHCIINKTKSYVCVVDGNIMACATKNKNYRDIINAGLVNICDGSSIALLAGMLHHQKFKTFTGPELFSEFVKQEYKQSFLGNTEENLFRLNKRFHELHYFIDGFNYETLPFSRVEDFDYSTIAKKINEFKPDIIWVSLGAPKQELFINNLYPLLNQGVIIAIGAAFNLFLDEQKNKRAPVFLRKAHLEWLYRVYKEPKRVGLRAFRYFILLPKLIIKEKMKLMHKKYYK